jgi:hypothetical protein
MKVDAALTRALREVEPRNPLGLAACESLVSVSHPTPKGVP